MTAPPSCRARPACGSLLGVMLLAAILGPGAAAARAEPLDLALVLAADGSGSIDDEELRLQRRGYASALAHPQVLGAIRSGYHQAIAVAFIEWGGPFSQHTVVDWRVIRDEGSAAAFGEALAAAPRLAEGYNSISGAIDYAVAKLGDLENEVARRVIDVSGDGPQIGGRPVEVARDEAVLSGITINALVVDSPGGGYRGPGGMPLDEHYRRDVIGGVGAFVVVADAEISFADAILRKLLREIAGPVPARRQAGGAEAAADSAYALR